MFCELILSVKTYTRWLNILQLLYIYMANNSTEEKEWNIEVLNNETQSLLINYLLNYALLLTCTRII